MRSDVESLREFVSSLPVIQRMLIERLVLSDDETEIGDVAQEVGISLEGAHEELRRALRALAEEANRLGLLPACEQRKGKRKSFLD